MRIFATIVLKTGDWSVTCMIALYSTISCIIYCQECYALACNCDNGGCRLLLYNTIFSNHCSWIIFMNRTYRNYKNIPNKFPLLYSLNNSTFKSSQAHSLSIRNHTIINIYNSFCSIVWMFRTSACNKTMIQLCRDRQFIYDLIISAYIILHWSLTFPTHVYI